MKCDQSSVFRVAYNDGRLKMILSVPGGENSICSSMGCSIDNLKNWTTLRHWLRADFQDVNFSCVRKRHVACKDVTIRCFILICLVMKTINIQQRFMHKGVRNVLQNYFCMSY